MVTYYQDIQALKAFDKMYPSRRLVELDQENVFVLQTNVRCRNLDYLIETTVRDILLEMMRHNGTYVKINIYY